MVIPIDIIGFPKEETERECYFCGKTSKNTYIYYEDMYPCSETGYKGEIYTCGCNE